MGERLFLYVRVIWQDEYIMLNLLKVALKRFSLFSYIYMTLSCFIVESKWYKI
jgi:hypothetical protein